MYKYKGETIKYAGFMLDGKYCFYGFFPNNLLLLTKLQVENLELA
jgi:hypothetical protein